MVREIVTNIYCDFCLGEDPDAKVPAVELDLITVGNRKPRLPALCADHKEGWYDPLVEALDYMQIVDPTSKSPAKAAVPVDGGIPCPICGKVAKNKNSLQGHTRNMHGVKLGDLIRASADPLPGFEVSQPDVVDPDAPPEVTRAVCEEPGCDKGPDGGPIVYEWPETTRPKQALSVHLAKTHGVQGKSKQAKSGRRQRQQQEVLAS